MSFFSLGQYDTKINSENIKSSRSISYFERYNNSKSDYIELMLSVYLFKEKQDVCTVKSFF